MGNARIRVDFYAQDGEAFDVRVEALDDDASGRCYVDLSTPEGDVTLDLDADGLERLHVAVDAFQRDAERKRAAQLGTQEGDWSTVVAILDRMGVAPKTVAAFAHTIGIE